MNIKKNIGMLSRFISNNITPIILIITIVILCLYLYKINTLVEENFGGSVNNYKQKAMKTCANSSEELQAEVKKELDRGNLHLECKGKGWSCSEGYTLGTGKNPKCVKEEMQKTECLKQYPMQQSRCWNYSSNKCSQRPKHATCLDEGTQEKTLAGTLLTHPGLDDGWKCNEGYEYMKDRDPNTYSTATDHGLDCVKNEPDEDGEEDECADLANETGKTYCIMPSGEKSHHEKRGDHLSKCYEKPDNATCHNDFGHECDIPFVPDHMYEKLGWIHQSKCIYDEDIVMDMNEEQLKAALEERGESTEGDLATLRVRLVTAIKEGRESTMNELVEKWKPKWVEDGQYWDYTRDEDTGAGAGAAAADDNSPQGATKGKPDLSPAFIDSGNSVLTKRMCKQNCKKNICAYKKSKKKKKKCIKKCVRKSCKSKKSDKKRKKSKRR